MFVLTKFYFLICLLVFVTGSSIAQDIGVINISSPTTGCNLSNAEAVTVQIFNYGTNINSNFNVSYRINNGAIVTETVNLISPYTSGSTYTYTFSTPANLSIPGDFLMDAFTQLPGDINPANDSINDYRVISYALSQSGNLTGTSTVCSGENSGTLNLTGQTGDVLQWEFSVNGGSSWTVLNNINNSLNFSNLISSTVYRAYVKNGTCPALYSNEHTVIADSETIGGSISGSTTVCNTVNSGSLTLSDHLGTVNHWEFSEDSGSNWTLISNNTSSLTYANLTQTRIYRAYVQSGVCSFKYSTTATITVSAITVGGFAKGDTIVCSGANNGTVKLSGYTGTISHWEFSEDSGSNWDTIPVITEILNYNNLSTETWYRASVLSCFPSEYSTIAVVGINPSTIGGVVSGSTVVCSESNNGTLTLSAYSGTILNWEKLTDNGTDITTIPGTDPFLNYSNLTETTLFRAVIQNGICPSVSSQAAEITVDSITNPGAVQPSAAVCIMANQGSLELTNFNGNILKWQNSEDNGFTWKDTAHTSLNVNYENLITSTLYRAEVKNGVCPAKFSEPALITVDNISDAGYLTGDNWVCYKNNEGQIQLNNFSGSDIVWQYSSDETLNWKSIPGNDSSITYQDLVVKTFYRSYVKNGSCPADTSDPVTISVYERSVNAGNDRTISRGETINFNATGGISYLWEPNDNLNNNLISNPEASPISTTEYIVTITDDNGCIDSDTLIVTVKDPEELKIANMVTPNGDGYNDTWLIEPAVRPEVFVFNSNGKEIYSSLGYDNLWSAKFNGLTLPDGTYFYVVKSNGIIYKGSLTILTGK